MAKEARQLVFVLVNHQLEQIMRDHLSKSALSGCPIDLDGLLPGRELRCRFERSS